MDTPNFTYVREVDLPDDALVYVEKYGCKYRANKIILGKRVLIADFPLWKDPVFC